MTATVTRKFGNTKVIPTATPPEGIGLVVGDALAEILTAAARAGSVDWESIAIDIEPADYTLGQRGPGALVVHIIAETTEGGPTA